MHYAFDELQVRGDGARVLVDRCCGPPDALRIAMLRDDLRVTLLRQAQVRAELDVVDALRQWDGGEGQAIYFLGDSKTWLFGSQTNGLWRTTDGGATWSDLKVTQGHADGALYRSKSGVFYLGTPGGILRSPDGVTWAMVPNSGSATSPRGDRLGPRA